MKTSNFEYPYYNVPENAFPTHRCIGNNARRTLVLAESKDFEEHSVLLTKILRAAGLEFESDVSFVSLQKDEKLSFLNTTQSSEYDYLLLFGVTPRQIGLMTNSRLSLLKLESHTLIIAAPLSTIAKDAPAKRKLWGHLKDVFKI